MKEPAFSNAARSKVLKGRGSGSNDESRYLSLRTEPVDDGWYMAEEAPRVATSALPDRTQRLITKNNSPDIGFDQSINPYKGCEHGCIYCFARPTHAYLDLSPGLDFETRLFFKTDVRARLLDEVAKPSYRVSPIAMGTNTDPYQPLEKERGIMRQILQTLLEIKHPLSIVTKSSLILRDLDVLAELAQQDLVQVFLSVTTLDNGLKAKLEPRTAGPSARLRTIAKLSEAGVPTGAMVAPVVPFLNDHEIEAIVDACADAGAQAVNYILLRLPLEVRGLFEEWLDNHYPLKAQRVMSAVKQTRNGRAYDAQWHQRMVGQGELAQLIGSRFRNAAAKAGLAESNMPQLRTDLFTPPRHPDDTQMALF